MSTRLGVRWLWPLALATIVGYASVAHAQATGTISGKITEKGGKEPLMGATVIVLGTPRGAQTGEDGSFTITNVPVGPHNVKILELSHEPLTRQVTVNAGQ